MTKKRFSLKDKWSKIPLDKDGNPRFEDLGWREDGKAIEHAPLSVCEVFTDEEIVVLVNRELYREKYMVETHRNKYVSKRKPFNFNVLPNKGE